MSGHSQSFIGAPCCHSTLTVFDDDPLFRQEVTDDLVSSNNTTSEVCSEQITCFVHEASRYVRSLPSVIMSNNHVSSICQSAWTLPFMVQILVIRRCTVTDPSSCSVSSNCRVEGLVKARLVVGKQNKGTGWDWLSVDVSGHVEKPSDCCSSRGYEVGVNTNS